MAAMGPEQMKAPLEHPMGPPDFYLVISRCKEYLYVCASCAANRSLGLRTCPVWASSNAVKACDSCAGVRDGGKS
jgi:hypothetical protein